MRPTERRTRPLPGTVYDPRYPDQDGRPIGDTLPHSQALRWLCNALAFFFRSDSTVLIAMNLIFYYRQGSPRSRRDPDVLVARGVGNHVRRSYRLWEEGTLPCTLFEIASLHTWREDVGPKRRLYARLNVPEYFIFDPDGAYLSPVLRGFQSVNGRSIEMTPAADGSLVSEQLGLRLTPEGMMLRLHDLKTGLPILTQAEQADVMTAENQRLRAELARRPRRR
jgi:Uma2 family endonuclease